MIHVVGHTSSYEQSASYFTIRWQQQFMCSKFSLLVRETTQARHSFRLQNEDFLADFTHFLVFPAARSLASRRGVYEAFALLGCYAELIGSHRCFRAAYRSPSSTFFGSLVTEYRTDWWYRNVGWSVVTIFNVLWQLGHWRQDRLVVWKRRLIGSYHLQRSLAAWSLKIGPTGCTETSVDR